MLIEEAYRNRIIEVLSSSPGLTADVFTDTLPQNPTYPCVLVQLIVENDLLNQTKRSALGQANVMVEVFAHESNGGDPYAEASQIADAIDGDGQGEAATGLSDWRQRSGDVEIDMSMRVQRRRGYQADELRLVIISQEYKTWFRASSRGPTLSSP